MSQIDLFNAAMSKADFKEKLARLLQYGAKMVSGLIGDADVNLLHKDRIELISKVCVILFPQHTTICSFHLFKQQ